MTQAMDVLDKEKKQGILRGRRAGTASPAVAPLKSPASSSPPALGPCEMNEREMTAGCTNTRSLFCLAGQNHDTMIVYF